LKSLKARVKKWSFSYQFCHTNFCTAPLPPPPVFEIWQKLARTGIIVSKKTLGCFLRKFEWNASLSPIAVLSRTNTVQLEGQVPKWLYLLFGITPHHPLQASSPEPTLGRPDGASARSWIPAAACKPSPPPSDGNALWDLLQTNQLLGITPPPPPSGVGCGPVCLNPPRADNSEAPTTPDGADGVNEDDGAAGVLRQEVVQVVVPRRPLGGIGGGDGKLARGWRSCEMEEWRSPCPNKSHPPVPLNRRQN